MKKYFLITLIFIVNIGWVNAQSITVKWKFKTGDKVLASPLIEENTLYIGGEDGVFYALNTESGQEKWRFKTRGYIQSKATIYENIIFFESSSVFFALDKTTGKELWRHDLGWPVWAYKIDHWDDIKPSAVVHDGVFYIGTSLGSLMGFKAESGEVTLKLGYPSSPPMRTTPFIQDGKIYIGDWAGSVYCISLETQKLIWRKATYEERKYDTFGGITSEMTVHNGTLHFGARNPKIMALNAETGEEVWGYTDTSGGWIVGSPVIYDNTLYIGGSDNYKMYAFNATNGSLNWTFDSNLNIYTKPIVTESEVIFTAGNAYWYFEDRRKELEADGGVFVINRRTGELISKFDVPEPVFSSPVKKGNTIYFGAYDGFVYALNLN